MNFYDIIESFAAKASTAKAPATTTAKAPATTTAKAPATSTAKAPATSTAKAPATTTAKAPATATASKSRSVASTTSASKSAVSSSLMSGAQKLTTVAAGSIVLDNIVDELIDEKGLFNGRRSGETIEQLHQLIQPQTVTVKPSATTVTPQVLQDKDNCDRIEDMGLEFRKPYLFMLKPTNDIMNNNEYNYRLICNVFLNNDNLNKDNKRYLYIFGLFPCKYIPSAYIPLNRKKLLENTKRLVDVKPDIIKNIFRNEVQFNKQFQNKIKQFMNKNTIYNNLNLSVFGIILIIYWSLVLLFLNYLMLYYFRSSFNNILAGILLILLLFSIIWKMIYTVQN